MPQYQHATRKTSLPTNCLPTGHEDELQQSEGDNSEHLVWLVKPGEVTLGPQPHRVDPPRHFPWNDLFTTGQPRGQPPPAAAPLQILLLIMSLN